MDPMFRSGELVYSSKLGDTYEVVAGQTQEDGQVLYALQRPAKRRGTSDRLIFENEDDLRGEGPETYDVSMPTFLPGQKVRHVGENPPINGVCTVTEVVAPGNLSDFWEDEGFYYDVLGPDGKVILDVSELDLEAVE